jgi:signal transduction histidine kinase
LTFAITEDYAAVISRRISTERMGLAGRWLHRLKAVLTVEPNQVFPSQQLLDHIPSLIHEIAVYLDAPEDEEIAANAAVIEKARELGILRHSQQASVHQLLREYEILSEILEGFVVDETQRLGLAPSWPDCFEVFQRLTRSARTLMRTTVDTFVAEYAATIQERNERLKGFNRMASHELRSPIGTLLFAATALESESESEAASPDRFRLIARTVRGSAERMSWLVQNLARLTRLDEPLDIPSEQEVEIGSLATEVARQLADMASARRVHVRVAEGLPAVHADPARLELVLLNLVSNGIKYSEPDRTESFVAVEPEETGEATTCSFRVRDNGIGISREHQPAVFSRFFRGHPDRDAAGDAGGTGLGLAIVAECVAALGGTIRFESVPGKGTTFIITIPCRSPAAPVLPDRSRHGPT